MLTSFKKISLLGVLTCLILSPAASFAWQGYATYGGWDYNGSGRDHPYSAYIDRVNYVGYADYAPIKPDFIDGPLVLNTMPAPPVVLPVVTPPPAVQPEQFTVNIPNSRGGYNAVVIKRSGDGYVGPNGEYYPEFPKTFQLQMKYGQ